LIQAQTSHLAHVLFLLHTNANTVNLTREMIVFFILPTGIWTSF